MPLLPVDDFQRLLTAQEEVEPLLEEPFDVESVHKAFSLFVLELDREAAQAEHALEVIEVQFVHAQDLLLAKRIRISKFKDFLQKAKSGVRAFRTNIQKATGRLKTSSYERVAYKFEYWHLGAISGIIGGIMAALSPVRRAIRRIIESAQSRWTNRDLLGRVSRLRKDFSILAQTPSYYQKSFNSLEEALPLHGHLDKKVIKEIDKVLKASDELKKHLKANGPMDKALQQALKELTQIERKLS